MMQMVGSPKQVKWAEELRSVFIAEMRAKIDSLSEYVVESPADVAFVVKLRISWLGVIGAAETMTSSKFWIERGRGGVELTCLALTTGSWSRRLLPGEQKAVL
jgi:hypothetical protein